MARPKKTDSPDLTQRVNLTAGAIERLTCPAGKAQAFLRDTEAPSLRVRVTRSGAKSYVFESKLSRTTIRSTIGSVNDWAIDAARAEARRLAVLIDKGIDPRALAREQAAEKTAQSERLAAEQAAQVAKATADSITFGEAWAHYCTDRASHWSERHLSDHGVMTRAGGTDRKRRPGVQTKPGPLAHFVQMRLIDVTAEAVEAWARREAADRAARVRLALRMMKAFFRWAADEPQYRGRVDPAAASAKKTREAAGKAKAKRDVLERGQLNAWFDAVKQIQNPVAAAYLQTLLLTGARMNEVQRLRWNDINWQWRSITLGDKIEDERTIPLTPYVACLLRALPRRNDWIFSSVLAVSMEEQHAKRRARYHAQRGTEAPTAATTSRSISGQLADPGTIHRRACAGAGLSGLTLHGLRRSFASLTEWLEVPEGAVAQIQGHKPSATREKHYKVRPLDLLRVHHERIEGWMLNEAGVPFDASVGSQLPRLVATG